MKKSWRFIITVAIVMAGFMGMDKALAANMADVRKESERGGYRLITTDELWNIVNRDPAATLQDANLASRLVVDREPQAA